jgi:hypothetical protein
MQNRYRSSDSGVVLTAGRTSPASRYSIVPTSAVVFPAARNTASIRNVVVVLPFVPVTPVSFSLSSGFHKNFAPPGQRLPAVLYFDPRPSESLRRGNSDTTATAPRSSACLRELASIRARPGNAKNRNPGSTAANRTLIPSPAAFFPKIRRQDVGRSFTPSRIFAMIIPSFANGQIAPNPCPSGKRRPAPEPGRARSRCRQIPREPERGRLLNHISHRLALKIRHTRPAQSGPGSVPLAEKPRWSKALFAEATGRSSVATAFPLGPAGEGWKNLDRRSQHRFRRPDRYLRREASRVDPSARP